MSISVPRPTRLLLAGLAAALPLLAATPPATSLAAAKPAAHAARHHHRHHPARRAAAPSASQASSCSDTSLVPAPGNLDRIAAATLCLVNDQRAAHGLAPLQADGALAAAATGHSLDMAAHDYFDHIGPGGGDPLARIRRAGYIGSSRNFAVGENIAAATGSMGTPAATVGRWMQSPDHRANILSPTFRDTGIGVAAAAPALLGRGRGATYTEDFGVRH